MTELTIFVVCGLSIAIAECTARLAEIAKEAIHEYQEAKYHKRKNAYRSKYYAESAQRRKHSVEEYSRALAISYSLREEVK